MAFKGHCLCGGVQYSSDAAAVFSGNCYCSDCRRKSGSGHVTVVAVPASSVQVAGELGLFDRTVDGTGRINRHSFCPVCGTTLFTNPDAAPGLTLVRAGTLDDPAGVMPQMNILVASAPAWDAPQQGLATFAGMPPVPAMADLLQHRSG